MKTKPAHDVTSCKQIEELANIGIDYADWYSVARGEILRVCQIEAWNVGEFCDYLALLSPRMSVRRNVRAALEYVGNGKLLENVIHSIKVSIRNYRKGKGIQGPKTSAFAANLRGDESAITLDSWMAAALIGPHSNGREFRRKATRHLVERRIRTVAGRLRLSPAECQAAIWTGIIRSRGRTPQYLPIWSEYGNWLSQGRQFPLSGVISTDDYDELGSYVEESVDEIPF